MEDILHWALYVEGPRVLRYGGVWAFVGAINLSLFYLLNEQCRIGYGKVLCIILPTFLLKFFLQKFFAFQHAEFGDWEVELLKTTLRQFIFFGINLYLTYCLVELKQWRPLYAQFVLAPPLGTLNYLVTRWIFST